MPETSVSICTIAMNRLHHVQITLPENLKGNNDPGINFILLDYNSSDGLGDYIQSNFGGELENGRLVYYRYHDAESFDRCHARNMAFKLADGEILCNLDADNYAGAGFGKFVQEVFRERQNVCLTGLANVWKHDASGKLCVSRKNFIEVTGYDENFVGYGFEDFDIVNRLRFIGCEPFTINVPEYLKAISHERNDRLSNESLFQQVEAIYVHFIDPNTSELLYQFKDKTCLKGRVINSFTKNCDQPESKIPNQAQTLSQFELPHGWLPGTWAMKSGSLQLSYENETEVCSGNISQRQRIYASSEHTYFLVQDETMRLEAISFFSEMENRQQMLMNLSENRISVNKHFGQGRVFKNFNQNEPIEV